MNPALGIIRAGACATANLRHTSSQLVYPFPLHCALLPESDAQAAVCESCRRPLLCYLQHEPLWLWHGTCIPRALGETATCHSGAWSHLPRSLAGFPEPIAPLEPFLHSHIDSHAVRSACE